MAWVVFALDGTLLQQQPMEVPPEMGGDPSMTEPMMISLPTDGAVEAVLYFMNLGHRISVWTDRFAPMPEERKEQLRQEIAQELLEAGFPPIEIWTGTTKPAADVYIDRKAVTFDDDWGLAIAQAQQQLIDQGLFTDLPMDESGQPMEGDQPGQPPAQQDPNQELADDMGSEMEHQEKAKKKPQKPTPKVQKKPGGKK